MTKLINFYGGPGSGKSTFSAQLFGIMKAKRMNVEYVPEFAKDLTWKQSKCIDDQIYVFANQHHALYTLLGQVDYIITDSPLLLSLHYVTLGLSKFNRSYNPIFPTFEELIRETYRQYENIDYFVERGDRQFIQAGRNQNEQQAKEIDTSVYDLLNKEHIPFKTVNNILDVVADIPGAL